jgi:hypothetical protein
LWQKNIVIVYDPGCFDTLNAVEMFVAKDIKTEFWMGRWTVWQNYKGVVRTMQYFTTFWKGLEVFRLQETFSKNKVRTDQRVHAKSKGS